jgi:hypothetical protein
MFDSAQSTAPSGEDERTELNPSKTSEMELLLIENGLAPSTSISERTTAISQFASEISNSADLPRAVTDPAGIAAAVLLQKVTMLETTSSELWLRSQATAIGARPRAAGDQKWKDAIFWSGECARAM